LGREDGHGDSSRQSSDDRVWHIFDVGPQADQSKADKNDAGHKSSHQHPLKTMAEHNVVQDHDQCAGRPSNPNTGASQQRNEKTGHDGGKNSPFRSDVDPDGDGHGSQEGDHAHRHSGEQVFAEKTEEYPSSRH